MSDTYDMSEVCVKCGTTFGDHSSLGDACPIDMQSGGWHPTQRFEAVAYTPDQPQLEALKDHARLTVKEIESVRKNRSPHHSTGKLKRWEQRLLESAKKALKEPSHQ